VVKGVFSMLLLLVGWLIAIPIIIYLVAPVHRTIAGSNFIIQDLKKVIDFDVNMK
jgi:Na+(H+)/acetate symporter ActP